MLGVYQQTPANNLNQVLKKVVKKKKNIRTSFKVEDPNF